MSRRIHAHSGVAVRCPGPVGLCVPADGRVPYAVYSAVVCGWHLQVPWAGSWLCPSRRTRNSTPQRGLRGGNAAAPRLFPPPSHQPGCAVFYADARVAWGLNSILVGFRLAHKIGVESGTSLKVKRRSQCSVITRSIIRSS